MLRLKLQLAHGSQDMPDRDVVAGLKAVEDLMSRGATAVDFY